MSVPLSNRLPANQAALKHLPNADPEQSYLVQLADWGLSRGLPVSRPQSPSQPGRAEVEQAVDRLLGMSAMQATRWLLSSDNLPADEQAATIELLLNQAQSPQAAAAIVLETLYDRMVAASEYSPE